MHRLLRIRPAMIGSTALIALSQFSTSISSSPVNQRRLRALEKQGQAEGWTFKVSLNPATQYPTSISSPG